MKRLIIDTNILYHYLGDEKLNLNKNNRLDYPLLLEELNKYAMNSSLFISATSLLEITIHFRDEPKLVKEVYKYIIDKKFMYLSNSMCEYNEYDTSIICNLSEEEIKFYIYNVLIPRKVKFELEYIFMFIVLISIPILFAITQYDKQVQEELINQIETAKYDIKNLFMNSKYSNLLHELYISKNEKNETKYLFEYALKDFLIPCLDTFFSKTISNYSELLNDLLLGDIDISTEFPKLLSKKINRSYRDNLFNDEVVNLFRCCGYNELQIYHIKKIVEKFIKAKDPYRFKKNDIEDLLILGFKDNNSILLTADKDMIETISHFDNDNYEYINKFILKDLQNV